MRIDDARLNGSGSRLAQLPAQLASVEVPDLEALAVVGDRLLAIRRTHLPQQAQRALQGVTAHVIERPHVLVVEAQVRWRAQCLAVRADEAEVLDCVGETPAVVASLPLAPTAEAAHRRRRTALILRRKRHLVGPCTLLGAICVDLAIHFIANDVFADQARHHAAPATVRIDVSVLLVEQDVGLAWLALLPVPLPEVTELAVPARILMLEPLEVLLGLSLDAPEVDRPADREELRNLVDVVLLDNPVPCSRDVVMMDLDAGFLQPQHAGAVVILIDPAMPELRIGLLVLVAIGGAVLDERTNGSIDDGVVLPERVFQIALKQQMIVGVVHHRHQHRMAVADVTGFILLHLQLPPRHPIFTSARSLWSQS